MKCHMAHKLRVVEIAARHAGEAEEVLQEEGHVQRREDQPEIHLADALGDHTPVIFGNQ